MRRENGEVALLKRFGGITKSDNIVVQSLDKSAFFHVTSSEKGYLAKKQGRGPTILDVIMMANKHDMGHTFFMVGQKGSGKTSLAGWLAYLVYGSWETALNHIVYDIEEFDALKEQYDAEGRKAPLVIIDDASLHLNSRRHWDPAQREFIRSFATIREWINTVLFIAPDMFGIDSALRREMNGLIVVFSPADHLFSEKLRIRMATNKLFGGRIAIFFYIRPFFDAKTGVNRHVFIPIHTIDHPITFIPLPPNIKRLIDDRKRASTVRVDVARTTLSMRDPEVLKELNAMIFENERLVLKLAIEYVDQTKKTFFTSKELETYLYNDDVIGRYTALAGANWRFLRGALTNLTATNPALIIGSESRGYQVTASGRAYIQALEAMGKDTKKIAVEEEV